MVGTRRARGQQNRLEYTDTARYVAEHACSECQQIDQYEGTERRRFRQQQVQQRLILRVQPLKTLKKK